MSRMLSLQYLGTNNEFNEIVDSFLLNNEEALSSEFGTRAPKGHDFEIQIYFVGGHYAGSGTNRHYISNNELADIIFGDDMLSVILADFDLSRLDTINKYRLDPKRSYARIDRAIHRVGEDAVRFIRKFFQQRPNPLRANAESTIKKKGFDQYGVDTGKLISQLRYRVKYAGSKTFK